jgi:hypothetical protein
MATWVNVVINGVTPPPPLSSAGYNVLVQVANPAQPNNQALNLNASFMAGSQVLLSTASETIPNQLQLYLANPNPVNLVPAGAPALFQLNFLYDSQAQNALATLAEGMAFTVSQATGPAWTVTAAASSLFPSWTFAPPAGVVLGPGLQANSMVSFTIGNIITMLPPGVTQAVVSYWNLAGFNDGQFAIPITKVNSLVVGIPAITGFTQPVAVGTAPSGTIGLSVQNATFIVVTNTSYVNPNPPPNCTDTIGITVSVPATYTVVAFNNQTGQDAAASAGVTFADNVFQSPIGSIMMWAGAKVTIPPGWQVCDGTNSTPNLIDSFIQGADPAQEGTGNEGALNSNGGPDTHTHYLAAATLTGTALKAGQHHHTVSVSKMSTTLGGSDSVWAASPGTYNTSSTGAHTHDVTVSLPGTVATQVQSASLMRPQWWALYFIMRLS